MRDLAIDPTTSDLALTASAATLTSGTDAKAQRLRTRLALWQGEYPLDLDVGIPFTHQTRLIGNGVVDRQAEAALHVLMDGVPG